MIRHHFSASVVLTSVLVSRLKSQPDTPDGLRNRVVLCLLFNERLSAKQICSLRVSQIDLIADEIVFIGERIKLSYESASVVRQYLIRTTPSFALVQSFRGGYLSGSLSSAGLYQLVKAVGYSQGIPALTPSMCREYNPTTLSAATSAEAAA